MTAKEIRNAVKECINEQVGVELEKIVPDARICEDLDIDSLDRIEIVMALEDKLSIYVEDEDIDKWVTVQDVYDHIYKQLKLEV